MKLGKKVKKDYKTVLKKKTRASLVVQQLRIRLPMQGTQV